MRISMDKMLKAYQTERLTNEKKQGSTNDDIEFKMQNYDQIKITSDRKKMEEKKLFEQLSKKVSEELQQNNSDEKLEKLKYQIDNEQYVIDAKKISKQIIWKNQVE